MLRWEERRCLGPPQTAEGAVVAAVAGKRVLPSRPRRERPRLRMEKRGRGFALGVSSHLRAVSLAVRSMAEHRFGLGVC
jgi:hypothetical protein